MGWPCQTRRVGVGFYVHPGSGRTECTFQKIPGAKALVLKHLVMYHTAQ